jgi:hypothetical protein
MICTTCGFDNPDGMKFCGECGNRLPTSEFSPARQPPQTMHVTINDPERKIVTALFSDLTGYTLMRNAG